MKVTVIMPVHDRAGFLPRSLGSLLAQKDDCDMDILVVDDGSQDATPEVLAGFARQHPQIRVVRRENGGVTKARNTGLANLLPETGIVTFLDSDDFCAPGRFRADLAEFARDPGLQVTYGRMLITNGFDDATRTIPAEAETIDVVGPHLSPALIRRDVIERTGRFDEDLVQSEDVDYLLRIFERRTRFLQTETVCFYYIRHDGNMTNRKDVMSRSFALALLKSIRRRKADPDIVVERPAFQLEPIVDYKAF